MIIESALGERTGRRDTHTREREEPRRRSPEDGSDKERGKENDERQNERASMGVSRSCDDYRLGKPIIHAAISPFPLLLYGCSGSFHYFFLPSCHPPPRRLFSHSRPAPLSPMFALRPVSSLPPCAVAPCRQEGRYLHFLRDEPCLPFGYESKRKVSEGGSLDPDATTVSPEPDMIGASIRL